MTKASWNTVSFKYLLEKTINIPRHHKRAFLIFSFRTNQERFFEVFTIESKLFLVQVFAAVLINARFSNYDTVCIIFLPALRLIYNFRRPNFAIAPLSKSTPDESGKLFNPFPTNGGWLTKRSPDRSGAFSTFKYPLGYGVTQTPSRGSKI